MEIRRTKPTHQYSLKARLHNTLGAVRTWSCRSLTPSTQLQSVSSRNEHHPPLASPVVLPSGAIGASHPS